MTNTWNIIKTLAFNNEPCASGENESCTCPPGTMVYYGIWISEHNRALNQSHTYLSTETGSDGYVTCELESFGNTDPKQGTQKKCYCGLPTSPIGIEYILDEDKLFSTKTVTNSQAPFLLPDAYTPYMYSLTLIDSNGIELTENSNGLLQISADRKTVTMNLQDARYTQQTEGYSYTLKVQFPNSVKESPKTGAAASDSCVSDTTE